MPTLSDGSPLYSLSQPGDGETWRPHLLCLRCCAAQQVCLLSTGNHGPKHVTWISNRKGKKSSRPRKRKKNNHLLSFITLLVFSRTKHMTNSEERRKTSPSCPWVGKLMVVVVDSSCNQTWQVKTVCSSGFVAGKIWGNHWIEWVNVII